jgi:hypothetical protein
MKPHETKKILGVEFTMLLRGTMRGRVGNVEIDCWHFCGMGASPCWRYTLTNIAKSVQFALPAGVGCGNGYGFTNFEACAEDAISKAKGVQP